MKALITGITGQDGYYLSSQLLEKDYEVHGLIRRASNINTSRIDPLISKYGEEGRLQLYYSDLLDSSSLTNLINKILPDEIYNLAAQSHVAVSFKNPIYSTYTSTVGPITILDSIRNIEKDIKFYQALEPRGRFFIDICFLSLCLAVSAGIAFLVTFLLKSDLDL